MPKPIIYTLGTSTHSREDFLKLLRHYQIEAVVDVRSFPQSRLEHFKKGNLARILKEGGLTTSIWETSWVDFARVVTYPTPKV